MDKKGNNDKDERTAMQAVGFVSGIGIQFAALILVFIFLGKEVDDYLQISPWGTLVGIIAGFFAGIWTTYKKLLGKQ